MNQLKDRVKHLRISLKIGSQEKLAELLQVNGARVKSIETGRVKEMTAQEANILVKNFNLNIDWLLTGKGEMLIDAQKNTGTTVTGNNNITTSGSGNTISGFNKTHKETTSQIHEISKLLQEYASQKFLNDLQEKLLKIKELHE